MTLVAPEALTGTVQSTPASVNLLKQSILKASNSQRAGVSVGEKVTEKRVLTAAIPWVSGRRSPNQGDV